MNADTSHTISAVVLLDKTKLPYEFVHFYQVVCVKLQGIFDRGKLLGQEWE